VTRDTQTPTPSPATAPAVFFTAFEPSGDALAAPVIKALLERRPDLKVYAIGGPLMAEAGAAIVERTSDDGAMGLSALGKVFAVRGIVSRTRRWSKQYRVLCHVPVDSPAANFPLAKLMHQRGAKIVHLAAPQLWAWGSWRLAKLKRLTSLVLCLLPFERRWFAERMVPAAFIGHPVMNRPFDETEATQRAATLPRGGPKLLLLPGSRTSEVRRNIRMLAHVFMELQGRHQGMAGLIVAASPAIAELVRKRLPVFPTGLHMISAHGAGLDGAIRWCDLAIAVSGTVTLDLTRQCKPMVGVYKTSLLSAIGARIMLRTPYRLLPNIIAGREIAPEFVPHAGGAGPIIEAAATLLRDSRRLAEQSQELARIGEAYAGRHPAEDAAEAILATIGTVPVAGAAGPGGGAKSAASSGGSRTAATQASKSGNARAS